MASSWLSLVLLIASSVGVTAQQNAQFAEVRSFLDVWERCVVEKAKRYAKTPDAAEFIVRVATMACGDEKRATSEALTRAGQTTAVLVATLNVFEQDITQAAAVAVLEARSKP